MALLLFGVLLFVLSWLVTRDMPGKYRYLALALLLILIITTSIGVYSYRWYRTTNTVSSLSR